MEWIVALCLLIVLFGIGYLFLFRWLLISLWQEPVLSRPVLIIESDDWGPAEPFEAERLRQLIGILKSHRDSRGRHPVMTMGLILSVPDTQAIREKGTQELYSLFLDDPRFSGIREALVQGERAGVFALQLHGMAHYLPETLLKQVREDEQTKEWLLQEGIPDPWNLRPELQSRWIDGSQLPSRPLDEGLCQSRASEEAVRFKEIFGNAPAVAVPPTFIWTLPVEAGWCEEGIKYIVTPGRRYISRDKEGRPVAAASIIRNGERSDAGSAGYLVRDIYFEPGYGHQADKVLQAAALKWKLGRPALTETHRFNFNGSAADNENALKQLDQLLKMALEREPNILFISTEELGDALSTKDERIITQGFIARFPFFLRRAASELPVVRRFFPG